MEVPSRQGIGLCLSGGGYRATLFHLGALRRLNELGVLAHPELRTVASVSGGSLSAAVLAAALARRGPGAAIPVDAWDDEIFRPLRALTRRDLRTSALLSRLLPWNLFRPHSTVETLVRRQERPLRNLPLAALPSAPQFLFLATDMAYGVAWVFSRERIGDYQVGYAPPPPGFSLARAVAASACCPPFFAPMRLRFSPDALTGGSAPRDARRRACLARLALTDGGVYDNMALEPVWKSHAAVLVCDAGGVFTLAERGGLGWRLPRYQSIQEAQARALRKRWLVAGLRAGTLDGAYWGVGGATSSYGDEAPGYSKPLARDVIATVRTDLDAFSDAEAAVLENHGYTLTDAALRRHLHALLPCPIPALVPPRPEWFAPARTEGEIRVALAGSGRRRIWGRR